jgi:hypothetical protein
MPVDMVEDLACLPCQQMLSPSVGGPLYRSRINLPTQQRASLDYRTVRGLSLVKVSHGRIQQCDYMIHPIARSALTDLQTELRFTDLSLHCRGTVSAPEKDVDRELQWAKAPSIEGLRARRQKWSWLAIAALLWSGCAAALSPDLTIKELRHTAWGPSQGAPLGGAVALAQTNDGYLWIAGPSGLFRFDGIVFERVELPRDPKLSSLSLFSAFAPRGGGLWVGFTFGGVALLKDGRWQVFSVADGLPQSSPWQFAETPDGTLWVATGRNLARFDGARWKVVGSEMGLPPSDNPILFVDSRGTLWAGGGNSLFFLRPGEHQFRNQPVAVPTPWDGNGMAESSTGTVWLDAGFNLVPVAQNPAPGKPGRSSYGGLLSITMVRCGTRRPVCGALPMPNTRPWGPPSALRISRITTPTRTD